jgi:hypothetical protein
MYKAMKTLLILMGLFLFASCARSQGLPFTDKKQASSIDTLKYIYEINKKIEETVLPYIESLKTAKSPAKNWQEIRTGDSTSLVELNQQLKNKEELRVQLQKQHTEDSTLIAKVKITLNDAVNQTSKGSANDVWTKLAGLYPLLNLYVNLEEYQKLSSDLASFKALLSSDFKSVTNVKNQLTDFTSKESKFARYLALKKEAETLKPTLSAYAEKINGLNSDFERYFVLWKNNPVGDRIAYLEERLIEFRNYPYLLDLIFNAIEHPEGTNPLKNKLN